MAGLTDWEITEAMIKYGGSFVHNLGLLFRQADPENAAALKSAFPTLWEKYTEIVINRGAALHGNQNAG